MTSILVLNGPNLNLLGSREPEVYGSQTLDSILSVLQTEASQAGFQLESLQSNAENVLIDRIHQTRDDNCSFLIFNPGAFTHTSIALRDAIAGVELPFIEVHLSNVYAREDFRKTSYFSDIALGVISGLGAQGYSLALQAAINHLQSTQ